MPSPVLRPELLQTARPDGSLEIYDPLLDRLLVLSAAEASSETFLAAHLLLEDDAAARLRAQVLAARRAAPPRTPPTAAVPDLDWSAAAAALPEGSSAAWRGDGERLRRLAEERAAGQTPLILRDFVDEALWSPLLAALQAAPAQRMETALLRAWRVSGAPLAPLRALLEAEALRQVIGGLLGVPLAGPTHLNGWRLEAGDHMGIHPDGPRYQATVVLGLCPGWRAQDGGAIAFGEVDTADACLSVRTRWLPHAGDMCLIVPTATTWHQVEPPRRTRWTASGWWMAAAP